MHPVVGDLHQFDLQPDYLGPHLSEKGQFVIHALSHSTIANPKETLVPRQHHNHRRSLVRRQLHKLLQHLVILSILYTHPQTL